MNEEDANEQGDRMRTYCFLDSLIFLRIDIGNGCKLDLTRLLLALLYQVQRQFCVSQQDRELIEMLSLSSIKRHTLMRLGMKRRGREEELVIQPTMRLDRSLLFGEDVIVLFADTLHVNVQDLQPQA